MASRTSSSRGLIVAAIALVTWALFVFFFWTRVAEHHEHYLTFDPAARQPHGVRVDRADIPLRAAYYRAIYSAGKLIRADLREWSAEVGNYLTARYWLYEHGEQTVSKVSEFAPDGTLQATVYFRSDTTTSDDAVEYQIERPLAAAVESVTYHDADGGRVPNYTGAFETVLELRDDGAKFYRYRNERGSFAARPDGVVSILEEFSSDAQSNSTFTYADGTVVVQTHDAGGEIDSSSIFRNGEPALNDEGYHRHEITNGEYGLLREIYYGVSGERVAREDGICEYQGFFNEVGLQTVEIFRNAGDCVTDMHNGVAYTVKSYDRGRLYGIVAYRADGTPYYDGTTVRANRHFYTFDGSLEFRADFRQPGNVTIVFEEGSSVSDRP